MSRSVWKGFYIAKNVLKKNKKQKKNFFKIWSRNSAIPSFLIGKTVLVHNGKQFNKVVITREKIGYKFGEFSLTRKYFKKVVVGIKKNKTKIVKKA